MTNTQVEYIALYTNGYAQEKPNTIIAVDSANLDEAEKTIKKANRMFDEQYLDMESEVDDKIEYILDALDEIPYDVISEGLTKIYL